MNVAKLSNGRFNYGSVLDQAMKFMAEGKWSSAARLFKPLVKADPRPEVWLQYGHALKEAGYHKAAEEAYNNIAPQFRDCDFYIQQGHLAKLTGNFQKAKSHYLKAKEYISSQGNSNLVTELDKFLAPLEFLTFEIDSPEYKDDIHLFISCISPFLLLEDTSKYPKELGTAHYSYAFACRGFLKAMKELGIAYKFIRHPEYISHTNKLTNSPRPVHIAFSPTFEARVLKGAYNILHFAWEFPRMKNSDENLSPHAFSDPQHMLNIFDEIWVPSTFGVEVIRSMTRKPVKFVPSPVAVGDMKVSARPKKVSVRHSSVANSAQKLQNIEWVPLSIFPPLQGNFDGFAGARRASLFKILSAVNNGSVPKIYLSIFNPFDQRKQIEPMLRAFCEFSVAHRDAVLLLKASSPVDDNSTINRTLLNYQISRDDRLALTYVCDRVWITSSALDDSQISALYQLASFYLCTSHAEGQNLPLLEAMEHGCVPISIDHTAMRDYISVENSLVIPSRQDRAHAVMRRDYGMYGFYTYFVSFQDVREQLEKSVNLTFDAFAALSDRSKATVDEKYGLQIFHKELSNVHECLTNEDIRHVG